jgi:hypothetical protein
MKVSKAGDISIKVLTVLLPDTALRVHTKHITP